MSLDKMLRDVVREEVAKVLGPLQAIVSDLQAQGAVVARLAAALGTPIKRGPGRPPKAATATTAVKGKRGRKAAVGADGGARVCALEDCGRPARSKGYCAAHYQKFRMLERTGRLPGDWKPYAAEGSVKNLALPRGRAGAKALAEARKK
jgi:hypothetical protein